MPTGDPKTCPHCGAVGQTFTTGSYDICNSCGERIDTSQFAFKPIRKQCDCCPTAGGLLHIETSPQGIKILWCTVCHGQKCAPGVTAEQPEVKDVLRYNEAMTARHRAQEADSSPEPLQGPGQACSGCGSEDGWKFSDEHPETCWQCLNCNEHHSRNRESVYVPIGMTREQAQEVLVETPIDKLLRESIDKDVVTELGEAIADTMKPYLLGKVVNPEYKSDAKLRLDFEAARATYEETICEGMENLKKVQGLLSDAVSRGEELSHALRRFDAGDDDATDRELKASEDVRAALKTENQALELLWAFIDVINEVPRHGNAFTRAGEALERARHMMGQLKDAKQELSILRKHSTREHISMANSEINKLREKVNPA